MHGLKSPEKSDVPRVTKNPRNRPPMNRPQSVIRIPLNSDAADIFSDLSASSSMTPGLTTGVTGTESASTMGDIRSLSVLFARLNGSEVLMLFKSEIISGASVISLKWLLIASKSNFFSYAGFENYLAFPVAISKHAAIHTVDVFLFSIFL